MKVKLEITNECEEAIVSSSIKAAYRRCKSMRDPLESKADHQERLDALKYVYEYYSGRKIR